MKHAIIFPGQGSQSIGMLADLASNFATVQETFSNASDVLGFDLWKLTSEDNNALNQTQNTQPAMLVAGYAVYKILVNETNLTTPQYMAGHSLGEYTALVAAGSLDFTAGVKLVQKRAQLMQNAVPEGIGAMAAILGLDDEVVIKTCAQYEGKGIVEAVNFNANGQVVIAGNKNAVEKTCEMMKTAGAKRAVILPVSVPSHSSLMKTAALEFAEEVNNVKFNMSDVNILHNVDALKAVDVNDMKNKLVAQLHQPVLWTTIIKNMSNSGVEKLIESGPGKILTGLTRRIDRTLKSVAVFDTKSLKEVMDE